MLYNYFLNDFMYKTKKVKNLHPRSKTTKSMKLIVKFDLN